MPYSLSLSSAVPHLLITVRYCPTLSHTRLLLSGNVPHSLLLSGTVPRSLITIRRCPTFAITLRQSHPHLLLSGAVLHSLLLSGTVHTPYYSPALSHTRLLLCGTVPHSPSHPALSRKINYFIARFHN